MRICGHPSPRTHALPQLFTDLPGANILKFGIESKRSSPSTSTHAFKRAIVEALHDLRLICEEGMAESSYTVSSNNEEQIQARL